MIQEYVNSLSPVLIREEIKDKLFVHGAITVGDKTYRKMDTEMFRREIAQQLKGNRCFFNADNSEIYIGEIYEPNYDFYMVRLNDMEVSSDTKAAVASSLAHLGVTYVGDTHFVEMYTGMLDDTDFMKPLEPSLRRTIASLSENGCKRDHFYRISAHRDLSSLDIDKFEKSGKKRDLLRIIQKDFERLKEERFNIMTYSYPEYEAVCPHDRIFISNLLKSQEGFLDMCINDIDNVGEGVAPFLYNVNDKDRQFLDLFFNLLENILKL